MKLEVRKGCFGYPGKGRTILENIDFSLENGDIMTILGPNGAGKTTLLRCITGLLKWQSGGTFLDGKDIETMRQKSLHRLVSYVPQTIGRDSAYTAEEMIMLGRAGDVGIFSMPNDKDREAVDAAIKKTGIEAIRNSSCNKMSGGELRMVTIARALVSEPRVLILDEPEANLDFKNQLLVLDLIEELAAGGMICIFNTHYPSHALRRSGKTLMLSPDGAYTFGNSYEVVSEENILKYFGVHSVIGSVESDDTSYSDVVPVSVGTWDETLFKNDERVIAAVTVMLEGNENASGMNEILHEFGDCLMGRMGIPYKRAGINIVTIMADAARTRVCELNDRISRLPGAHVKMSFLKQTGADEKGKNGCNRIN